MLKFVNRCNRKVMHSTKESAERALNKLVKKGGYGLSVYKCKHCKSWHTGHLIPPSRKRWREEYEEEVIE